MSAITAECCPPSAWNAVRDRAEYAVGDAANRAVCEAVQQSEQQRRPVLQRLVQDLGGYCGIGVMDLSGSGDTAARKLRNCAQADPQVTASANAYLDTVREINHAACMVAKARVEEINDEWEQRQRQAGQSFVPVPIMTDCQGNQRAEQAWYPLGRGA